MINTNPDTGIRYGIISALDLHQEIVDELQAVGTDEHWHDFLIYIRDSLRDVVENHVRSDVAKELVEQWVDELAEYARDSWYDDEPVHQGTHCGVKYRTTWIGGAMHVWVFESPTTGHYAECSPCVPCAGNLDCPDPEGVVCYDVPDDWRDSDAT